MEINGVDKSLREKWFPSELIINGFVSGDDKSNYELYLLELVNASNYMKSKLLRGEYHLEPDQSHSEPDCRGNGYELDFKICESESLMRAKSIFSIQPFCVGPGVRIYSSPRVTTKSPNYKPIDATILHKALRGYTVRDLVRISKTEDFVKHTEHDIKRFLNNLSTNKNIMLFLPIEFYFEKGYSLEEGCNQIVKLLLVDFGSSMEYRKGICKDKDTFLTFYHKDTFVLLKYIGKRFRVVDYISKDKMPTFCYLEGMSAL